MADKKIRGRLPLKFWVIIVLVVLIGFFSVFDWIRSTTFTLKIVSVTPEPVVATSDASCELVVQLTDQSGKPVAGHEIYSYVISGGGSFSKPRNTTDENGMILLKFKPQPHDEFRPATNVKMKIYDESNSVFIMIPTTIYYELKVVAPSY
mgnify:CR=1 FL=1